MKTHARQDRKVVHERTTLTIRDGNPIRVFHYDGLEVTHKYTPEERRTLLKRSEREVR
mgnify:CR=1 FL=1